MGTGEGYWSAGFISGLEFEKMLAGRRSLWLNVSASKRTLGPRAALPWCASTAAMASTRSRRKRYAKLPMPRAALRMMAQPPSSCSPAVPNRSPPGSISRIQRAARGKPWTSVRCAGTWNFGPRLTRAWQEMEQITIGAIEGFCIGGGVALAVALDFRVMASDAHMRVPEIGLGMSMSWQSVPRMLHLMGPARTKQAVILANQRISAAEAYEWGLVEEVAAPGKSFDAAMVLAAKITHSHRRSRSQ